MLQGLADAPFAALKTIINGAIEDVDPAFSGGNDRGGVVVCSIDTEEYTEKHSREQWSYLKKGVMIEFQLWGLIHYDEPEEDLQLIERASG